MDKKGMKFFKCYVQDVSCIDCEYKEACNIFLYVCKKENYQLPVKSRQKEGE